MYVEINREAEKQMLEDNGIRAGLTKEKINGTYRRPEHVTQAFLDSTRPDYVVEFLKRYFDKYPDMFKREPNLKDKFFDSLKGDRIKLRKYPEIIRAMFHEKPDEIPEDLQVEDNQHKSMLVNDLESHISRRIKTVE